jgi:hypothetical protein
VVDAEGARDRLRKSAEPGVKLAEPGAPVIVKPAGAVICAEPSCWVDASFVMVNVNEVLAPAAGLAGETATAKHLPDEMHVLDVDPAAGEMSRAAPSMLAASAPKSTCAATKTLGTATPSYGSTEG